MSLSSHTANRKIPVARHYFGREEEELVLTVLRSGWVSQGPRVAEFEQRFAEYVGAKHALAVSSCTTALHLALLALGIRPGDEVLCPSFSFIATANSIVHAGATPVFVDIDRLTYNLDPARIEAVISPRTRAILAVHQVGLPAAIDEISAIASRHNLVLLEDAACAIGSEYRGRRIGAPYSAASCFSFHPRKIMSTGEGGMITVQDSAMAARLRRLRQHAMTVSDVTRHHAQSVVIEGYDEVGYNYRMTDLQAALGLVQLQRLDDFLARRRYFAKRYAEQLSSLPWLLHPVEQEECRHNFQSYMVRLAVGAPIGRDALMQQLLERGISTRRGVMAAHREPPYQHPRWDAQLPETCAAADETIVLPMFHQMTEEEQDYIVESIAEIGAGASE
jgi:perosamine synthetase